MEKNCLFKAISPYDQPPNAKVVFGIFNNYGLSGSLDDAITDKYVILSEAVGVVEESP